MLRITRKARGRAPVIAPQGCTCFLRPIHLAAPLASAAASTSSGSHAPSLADRIAARRGSTTTAAEPPPNARGGPNADDASRTSPRLSSIDNTTPRINELVDSALSGLPRTAAPPGRPKDQAGRRSSASQKKSQPSAEGAKRGAKGDSYWKGGEKIYKSTRTAGQASTMDERRGKGDRTDRGLPLAKQADISLSLEEQKAKIEERLGFLLRNKKTLLPWEDVSAEEKERLAWKMEMSVKAKERNKILAEEKANTAQEAASESFTSILGVSTAPPPPPRPPALPASGPNGLPKDSRRAQPDYGVYEELARERYEGKRKHHAMETAAYETKLEQVNERIESQQALDAAVSTQQTSPRHRFDRSDRAPQPSILTTFAEKLSLDPSAKEERKAAETKTEEELAAELNEYLPSKEMADAANVPYKRPTRAPRKGRSTPPEGDKPTPPPPEFNAPPLSSHPHKLSASDVTFDPLPRDKSVPIAQLSHNLTRVLFNPGVHFLRDPRSGVYNFPKRGLEDIPPVEQFEGEKMPEYITSSRDPVLNGLATIESKTFVGSTSSTVAMLCQIYFWLSKGKPVNLGVLSAQWKDYPADFSAGQRLPASVVLRYRDGHYAIDADKSMDATDGLNVLADYGHMMEKLLTTEPDEFDRFMKASSDPAPSLKDERQAYQYSTTDHMVLRSQLDAHDEHLPNVSFDVKTRGSVAVRMDRLNYVEAAGYDVRKLQGPWESFEREHYDLIRSAFLKYQFQARIGGMDGCFVAYHSTQRFFGFQYVSIPEMDVALFGSTEAGDQVFKLALGFLERILLQAKELYPDQSIGLTLAAGRAAFDEPEDVLRVFVQPAEQDSNSPEEEQDLTLIELRGVNYVDGVGQEIVDIQPVLPHSTGRGESASTEVEEAHIPVWQVGYSSVISRTTSSLPTTAASDADVLPQVPPSEIRRLFAATRSFQTMFTSLTLPAGISRAEVVAAAERQAALAAEGKELTVDPSDLAVRFPIKAGMEYRAQPSWSVQGLRKRAEEGKKRTEMRDAEDEREGKGWVEIESRKKVWS